MNKTSKWIAVGLAGAVTVVYLPSADADYGGHRAPDSAPGVSVPSTSGDTGDLPDTMRDTTYRLVRIEQRYRDS